MDMRLMRLGLPVLCKSLGFDPLELSKLTCRGLPWPSRKAGYPCRRRCRLPWLSEEVLGSRPGVAYCRVVSPGSICHAFISSRTASCHPPSSLTAQQWRGLSGNARKAFMDEASRLATVESPSTSSGTARKTPPQVRLNDPIPTPHFLTSYPIQSECY